MHSSDDYDSENAIEENFIDCGVKDMSTLHLKTNITTLNLHYNNISLIKGLHNLPKLKHLDLSSNVITKISGLEFLVSLRTLNLSCNRLKKLEGLSKLRQLVRLNVSYNDITDLSGLSDLAQISGHPLTVVDVTQNQVRLISHVINSCQRLSNLRQLSLLHNPVCEVTEYRSKILNGLSKLRILDGQDRNGQNVEVNILSDIPGLEQFMEYLSSSTEPHSEPVNHHFRKKPLPSRDQSPKQRQTDLKHEFKEDSTQSESELKQRLQDLEEKLTKFVTEKQESATAVAPPAKEVSIRNEPVKENVFTKEDKKEKRDRSDLKIAKLMKDLDQERHFRMDAENKLQVVVTRYKELQLNLINDRKSKDDTMKAMEKLTSAFSKEKTIKESLELQLEELEGGWDQRQRELLDDNKRLECALEELKGKFNKKEKEMMNKCEEVQQLTQASEEARLKQQVAESSLTSVRKHCVNLEEQVNDLQMTLSRREKEYQATLASRFSIDSKELQEYTRSQVTAAKQQMQCEVAAIKDKLNDSNKKYKALEDEFRVALHMEADRFDKLEQSYLLIVSEAASLKDKLNLEYRKEEESKSLITELTTVVKDQKCKLIELSKNKQEKNKDNKERILNLEAHIEEARKQMIQFELTKQENKKLLAKQGAQESVIEGLKAERRLWSEELAQQGYLLTQDRAKLECKIEAQNSDISRIKMELEKEVEQTKNKSKMIEDQTATILKLKEGLLEKDQEARSFSEKLLDDQKELENRVKSLLQENSQYKDDICKLSARKEELKDVINNLEEKLDDALSSQELVNRKWKEKSELISKLESQVVQMKEYWEKKTEDLMEERNDAVEKYRILKSQFDSLEHNYKNQLEMAYKNRDFIKQEAEENIEAVENEMRRLLLETKEEKRKLQMKMQILNRAIEDVDYDRKS